jgi:hypothetical protein
LLFIKPQHGWQQVRADAFKSTTFNVIVAEQTAVRGGAVG